MRPTSGSTEPHAESSISRAGVMGAVARRARGRGAFKALLVGGLKWGEAQGLQWEEHGSLATNYPVNRAFADVGFRIAEAGVTLHAWLDR